MPVSFAISLGICSLLCKASFSLVSWTTFKCILIKYICMPFLLLINVFCQFHLLGLSPRTYDEQREDFSNPAHSLLMLTFIVQLTYSFPSFSTVQVLLTSFRIVHFACTYISTDSWILYLYFGLESNNICIHLFLANNVPTLL